MYHTKKIALFISHIFGDYQKNVSQGVVDTAREYGFRTEIYTTFDGENPVLCGAGEASVLRIPHFDDFSGIIVASGTYPERSLRDQILAALQTACSCPVIEIAENDTRFPSISLENNKTAGALAGHLITVHGCRRICYIGCSSEPYFSDQREQYYREAMAAHGLAVGSRDVCQCVYQEEQAKDALDFLSEGGSALPDAVICYNDRMALLVMAAAARLGYRIPEDFALVGCDALPDGQNITPRLTTVTFPTYELGQTAVRQLIRQMHKEEPAARTCISAEPLIGASCGCSASAPEDSVLFVHSLRSHIGSLEHSLFLSMQMAAEFSHVSDIDEGMDILARYVPEIEHCSEFYLCLYTDWDKLSARIAELTDEDDRAKPESDSVLLKLAIKNGKRLPECTFSKKTLLPDYIYRDSSFVHIASPLFFEEREFGYLAVSFKDHKVRYHMQMMHWIMNITQLLQSLCENRESTRMLKKLESIYLRDPLTELYSRHGLAYRLQKLPSAQNGRYFSAILFNVNGLRRINDTYGHSEGDFALQTIAHALRSAIDGDPDDVFPARLDGDTFCVLSSRFDKTDAAAFTEQVLQYLNNYNHLSAKPYALSVRSASALTELCAGFCDTDARRLIGEAYARLTERT